LFERADLSGTFACDMSVSTATQLNTRRRVSNTSLNQSNITTANDTTIKGLATRKNTQNKLLPFLLSMRNEAPRPSFFCYSSRNSRFVSRVARNEKKQTLSKLHARESQTHSYRYFRQLWCEILPCFELKCIS
jgi:hypothetical protein